MVIYEVNLIIHNEIYLDFYLWLVEHIGEMLTFNGFKEAKIQKDISENNDNKTRLTICYTIENMADIDDYLKTHAPAMRADGINRFGDKFSANRRIFLVDKVLTLPS